MAPALPDDHLDRLFDLLRDAERRHLCRRLVERDADAVSIEELVHDSLRYRTVDRPGASSPSRERAAVRMRHCHLPKLSDAGIVAYEAGDEAVRLRDSPAVAYLVRLHDDSLLDGLLAADGASPADA